MKYLFLQKDLNLRRTRWLKLLNDYDVHLQYLPRKANVVTDALSHRPYLALNCLLALPNDLCEEFWQFELNIITPKVKPMLCAWEAQSTLIEEIRVAKAMVPQLKRIREEILMRKAPGFVIHKDGTICFHIGCVFQQ